MSRGMKGESVVAQGDRSDLRFSAWRQGPVVVAAQGELGIGAVAWSRTGDDEPEVRCHGRDVDGCFRY